MKDFATARENWMSAGPIFITELLTKAGWTVKAEELHDCQYNPRNGLIYFVIDDTAYEMDLSDFTARHKGLEEGCFWSDWQ